MENPTITHFNVPIFAIFSLGCLSCELSNSQTKVHSATVVSFSQVYTKLHRLFLAVVGISEKRYHSEIRTWTKYTMDLNQHGNCVLGNWFGSFNDFVNIWNLRFVSIVAMTISWHGWRLAFCSPGSQLLRLAVALWSILGHTRSLVQVPIDTVHMDDCEIPSKVSWVYMSLWPSVSSAYLRHPRSHLQFWLILRYTQNHPSQERPWFRIETYWNQKVTTGKPPF